MKRLEFTDKQKAFIFQRDKWLCAFSGKILWVLHYWASHLYDEDWVDHIKPAMKWWDNSTENWICASSFFNSKKKDNSNDNKYLFYAWKTTEYFYIANWSFNKELSDYINNMWEIKVSDWYFNRALSKLIIWVDTLYNPTDLKWNLIKRDLNYWCTASLKKLNEWRKKSFNESIDIFKNRLNIDSSKLWEDQKIMLEIINSRNLDEIVKIANKLLPYYKNSIEYFKKLNKIKNKKELEDLEKKINNESFLSKRDREILLEAIKNPNFIIKN